MWYNNSQTQICIQKIYTNIHKYIALHKQYMYKDSQTNTTLQTKNVDNLNNNQEIEFIQKYIQTSTNIKCCIKRYMHKYISLYKKIGAKKSTHKY